MRVGVAVGVAATAGSGRSAASGAGKNGCAGERTTEIRVNGAASAPAPKASFPEGWSVASHEGAKFSCRANVGEGLEFLCFDQGTVEVEDERADHAGSAS